MMGREGSYRDLVAWQKAMTFVEEVYHITGGWPVAETHGLINQVRRAAVSIPANIAEGQGRSGTKEFLHHLSIAHGSLYEVETHLLIALRLDYLDTHVCQTLTAQSEEIGRLIGGLIRRLRVPAITP
jgi:four helix bundle protein